MIDIVSTGSWPSCELSNFSPHDFVLDGVNIRSMEGFLQALKYKSPSKQKKVCLLSGKEAKKAGKRKLWWRLTRRVYWNEKKYHLFSDDLQILIDRAYDAMYECSPDFRKALRESGKEELRHTIGKKRIDRTILTEYAFVQRLLKLREKALQERKNNQDKLSGNRESV